MKSTEEPPNWPKIAPEGAWPTSRWPVLPLSAVVEKFFVGLPVSRHVAKPGSASIRLSVMSVGDIENGRLTALEQLASTELQPGNFDRFRVREGDIVVSCRGTVLKAAMVPHETDGAFASSNLITIRADRSKLAPQLILAAFRSPPWQHILRTRTRSSTGLMQLTVKDLEDLPVPLPPLDLQAKLASLFDAEERAYRSALDAASARHALIEVFFIQALFNPLQRANA